MNNNRNNRRRGRGNRNQGGNNQLNRIDSRARGNAPQLLDKYKKLAQDAQHNGDRVQAEYYLQFADHYFRVIADNKARQEEARAKRAEEREAAGEDADEEGADDRRRNNRRGRGRRDDRKESGAESAQQEVQEGAIANEGEAAESADENRPEGGLEAEPARKRAPRRKPRETRSKSGAEGEIDAGVLPPSISADSEPADSDASQAAE